jgi:hypothetical protein
MSMRMSMSKCFSHIPSATLLLLLLLFSLPCYSQIYGYAAVKKTALVKTAEVITVQQPATGSTTVRFLGASVYCSVACEITVEKNGTAATTTTLAITRINPDFGPATGIATAWSSSNAGVGSVIGIYSIAAGATMTLDLSEIRLVGNGTGKNFTVRTDAITGTVIVNVQWEEF